jgi:hypothetical protein
MPPRHNNLYGQVVALDGLRPVLVAVEAVLGSGSGSVFRPAAARAETLRVQSDRADLETIPLAGDIEYLLNGAVGGSAEEILAFVRALSAALAEARIEHSFEVNDVRLKLRASVP